MYADVRVRESEREAEVMIDDGDVNIFIGNIYISMSLEEAKSLAEKIEALL